MMGADAGRSPPDGGRARAGEAASDVFEAWWAEYPRKEGRAAARKVFDAVLSRGDVSVAVLVSKARQYATAKAHIADSKYIKQPANWLKEECWLEDPQPPRAKSERTAKAKGKAEPVVEPDDDDDVEDFLTPEEFADEAGFPIGTCVWHRPTGYKGEVLGVEENHDVLVRWEKAGDVRHCADDLVFEPPFTPEQMAEMEAERAKSVAEAEAGRKAKRDEAEKKRLAEVERERGRRKLFERFPIGARVDSTDPDYEYLEDGEVVDHSDDAVLVDWGRYEGDTQWAYSAEELVLTRPGARCAS
jgi:hypothetical protein